MSSAIVDTIKTPFDEVSDNESTTSGSYSTPFDDMANYSKFSLIVKPAQGGKTARMIDIIRDNNERAKKLGIHEDMNFIFHGATLTLGRQTSERFASADTFDMKEVLRWNSEGEVHEDTSIENTDKTAIEVLMYCMKNHKKYILCCSHAKRFGHFMKLVSEALFMADQGMKIPNINIFIDEADQSMSIWEPHQPALDSYKIIKKVYLVTATPEDIIKMRGKDGIRVELDETPIQVDKYVGTQDQTFELKEFKAKTSLDYIAHVFEDARLQEKLLPRTRWFVPADVEKSSHDDVYGFFKKAGCNVVVVNGVKKAIYCADGRVIDLADAIQSSGKELGAILKSHWLDASTGLQEAPLVITGNLCIERGITFQDSREGTFLFDYSIIADIADAPKAYQVMARMFGNFNHVRGEHRGVIYTTPKMKSAIERQERIALKLSEVAKVKGTVTHQELLDHFPKPPRQIVRDPRATVPQVINVDPALITELINSSSRRLTLLAYLSAIGYAHYETLAKYKCVQFTCPETDNSYTKHIDAAVRCYMNNIPWVIESRKENKEINWWQVFIDSRCNRLVISIWNGEPPATPLEKLKAKLRLAKATLQGKTPSAKFVVSEEQKAKMKALIKGGAGTA